MKAAPGRDEAAKIAERLILKFWKDIEGHWFGAKMPIAKLEAGIARAIRKAGRKQRREGR